MESGSGTLHPEILESRCCSIPGMPSFTYSSRSLDLLTVVLIEELHLILGFHLLYIIKHELVNDQRLYS